jgi:hypothetical protein
VIGPAREGTAVASGRPRWLALSCAGVLAAVTGVMAWLVNRVPPLTLDKAQARAMLPVIDSYLDQHADTVLSGFAYLDPQLKPRIFCDAGIIEIRPDGPDGWSA